MSFAHINLAELVTHGMHAIQSIESQETAAFMSAREIRQTRELHTEASPMAKATVPCCEETRRLRAVAARLERDLEWVRDASPDDPLLIRKHIVRSVELFLTLLTENR